VINLESAKPAVDQPSFEVDGREVNKDVLVPLPIIALPHNCHTVSFINPNKHIWIYKKRDKNYDDIQLCTTNTGTKFPRRTDTVQRYRCTIFTLRGCLA
jgi:hypothetical protein